MTERPVVAVSGANGYVGSIIVDALRSDADIIPLVRRPASPGAIAWSFGADLDQLEAELRARGATHLVHAAWDMTGNSLAALQATCVTGSKALLQASRAAGITNPVFISSISAFAAARSAYGRAKLEVERLFLNAGGTVLRLGLVHGQREGGMFGNLRATVRRANIIPIIGRGTQAQYLLHEQTLGEVIRRAVSGDLRGTAGPITIADPSPIRFRDLVHAIASEESRKVTLVPVPWQFLYVGLRSAEALGLKLQFRSDSVLSFVHQDRAPDFEPMRRNGIQPVRYLGR